MYQPILQHAEEEFKKAILHLQNEFIKLRTGRANAALVENLEVECYGTKSVLKSIAGISIPDAKTIAIQPWDRSILGATEKAIRDANIGLNPMNDGILIRLNMPPMTEERRVELKKMVSHLAEEARIAVRNSRHESLSKIKKMKDDKQIGEDDYFLADKKLQEVVDINNKKIDELARIKEEEVMKI